MALQRAGVGTTGDILDVIAGWEVSEPERAAAARAAIAEVEEQALRDMKARHGIWGGGVIATCYLLPAVI